MPALAILYAATPRTPLSQRSALFASASWFGKAVWSGVVFVLSVVIGSVTGIVASRASEAESDMAMAIQLAFGATSQFVVWPVLATVVAIAYGVMGVRWFLDAGWLAEGGHAGQAVAWLERRWFPTRQAADVRSPLLLVELLLRIGQFALAATLLTVGLSAVTTIVRLLGP
jgi:hypothetical protein